MESLIDTSLSRFSPISLDRLNQKAAMLERLDNKYIVQAARLVAPLEEFAAHFDILEIDGRRSFTYATRYYDDWDLRSYFDHHQGRRQRSKIRIREYVDAGFSYLEVKLKDKRDITIKKRLKLQNPKMDLGDRELKFIDECHQEIYATPFDKKLKPVIDMQYRRITLVAREGGERMTLDTCIEFRASNGGTAVDPGAFILETKSSNGNGLADRVLRSHHLHPTKRCSKYCIGMAATGQVQKRNRFLPGLRKLALVGALRAV
ncbi:MAG TPA: polyphosphate polymerase domain-containing protein [Hyphomicrobiaceae bacterium]|nr:polyphosphate polymerase domain-containing protein [Hyphomicrobiaceae bacterium]